MFSYFRQMRYYRVYYISNLQYQNTKEKLQDLNDSSSLAVTQNQ